MTTDEFFQSKQPQVSASAPGTLDLMGGFTEIAGPMVLQMPLKQSAYVIAAFRNDDWVRIHDEISGQTTTLNLGPFRRIPPPIHAYRQAKHTISIQKNAAWAADLLGCVLTFLYENKLALRGIDFYVSTNLTFGKRAGVQIAFFRAMQQLYGIALNKTFPAFLAEAAETFVEGRPGTLSDKIASIYSTENALLPIHCQPDKVFAPLIPIPGLKFFVAEPVSKDRGLDKKLEEAKMILRTSIMMGYSVLVENHGVAAKTLHGLRFGSGKTAIPWHGWVCSIDREQFFLLFEKGVPGEISGEEFLEKYGLLVDAAARVEPERIYPISNALVFAVEEDLRARAFFQILSAVVPQAIERDFSLRHFLLSQVSKLLKPSLVGLEAFGFLNERTTEIFKEIYAMPSFSEVYGAALNSNGQIWAMVYGENGESALRDFFEKLPDWSLHKIQG